MVRLKELNLLLLEDNIEFTNNTIDTLNLHVKKVFHARNIKDALTLFRNFKMDVIISDIKVEDGNGLDFVTEVRAINTNIPIVILSAHKDEDFLFKAIPLKILSYELKPLGYDALHKLLQKIAQEFNPKQKVMIGKNLYYSYQNKMIYEDEKMIALTKKEMLFMELLLVNINKMLSIESIQRDVWEDKPMGEGALKNLIFRFRKKVKTNFLTTITNVGYRLSDTH